MSRCDIDLWPVDLESLWYIKHQVVKGSTIFERNQAISAELLIILRILHTLCHAVTLTFDLLTWNLYIASDVMCLKSVQNLASYWRCSTFSPWKCRRWGTTDRAFSSGLRGPDFTKVGDHIGRSSQHCTFCFRVLIPCCIFKRGRLRFEWCWKWSQMSRVFTPVKIWGGVDEISGNLKEESKKWKKKRKFMSKAQCLLTYMSIFNFM